MGDTATKQMPHEFFLRPEEIEVERRFARRWEGDEEGEARKIESLCRSIDREGQLYPALVTPTENHKGWILMDGHRRRRAVLLLNDKRTQQHAGELVKLRVQVIEGGDLVKKSVMANVVRESYGPMELALRIDELRHADEKYQGPKGTRRIADYLGVDAATVFQYEKFLNISPELQRKLGEGVISAQSALDLINVPSEKLPKTLERAAEIQKDADKKLGKRAIERREEKLKKTGKSQDKRIERPAIRQAIRETKVAKPIALSRAELLEALEAFDGPQYGHANGAVRVWVRYLVDEFAPGKGKTATMRRLFDQMTAKAGKGTVEKPVLESKTKTKPKSKTKAKAKTKPKTKPKAAKKKK